jgi:hypothetical protein
MANTDELFNKCNQTIENYGTRDSDLDALTKYYFLDYEAEGEQQEGIEVVHLPLVTNAIDLVQDLLGSADLALTVPSASEKASDKKLADTEEKFLRRMLEQSARFQHQDLIRRAAWSAAMRGAVCGRVMVVTDWLEAEEMEQVTKLPILFQLRDARHIYPEFGLDGLSYIVERQTRFVRDIRQTYGDKFLSDYDPNTEVEWIEYWDATDYAYFAGGESVKSAAHLYGGIPYSYKFCRQTSDLDPAKRSRPFIAGLTNVVERMDALSSMEATFIANYIGSSWLVTSDETDWKLDLTPGAINYLRDGEEVKPLQGNRKQIEIDEMYGKLQSVWERGTFPHTMYGGDPGRQMSGYSINLLNQGGRIRLQPMITAIEDMVAELCGHALMIAENYVTKTTDKPIAFNWYTTKETEDGTEYRAKDVLSLDAKLLGGEYHVEVAMGDLLPQDEVGNVALATQARTPGVDNRPLLSDETILEKYKMVDDTADERMRIDRQEAWAAPELGELRRAVLVAEMKEELIERLQELDVDVDLILESLGQGQVQQPQQQQLDMSMGPEMMPQGSMPQGPMMDGMPMPTPVEQGMTETGMPTDVMPPAMLGFPPAPMTGIGEEQLPPGMVPEDFE